MNEILHLINEMSPYLLLGFLIAGLMHAFIPKGIYGRYMSAPNLRSIINAALLGIPLPLCSCGVIPTAVSLHKEGASKGAVASFLIATPQTGIDSIIATYSLMGLPFAIIRPIVALLTALFGGIAVNQATRNEKETHTDDDRQEKLSCCHEHHHEATGKHDDHQQTHCCSHDHSEEHCHCHHAEVTDDMTLWQRLRVALQYAFVDMVEDIGKWLVVGLLIAALITAFVPDTFFTLFAGNTWMSILLVLAISIPMYICATGSIPIAVALMLKGLTPGAALVLLMAGPAANMASILIIRNRLGIRMLIAYLLSIIFGAILFGVAIDYCLPREWFTDNLVSISHDHAVGNWLQWTSTILLTLLLLNALRHGHHHHHHHE